MPIKQYVKLTTEPAVEAEAMSLAKLWLRVDDPSQDQVIAELIRAARELCESQTGRATTSATYTQVLDRFPLFLGNESLAGYPTMPAPIVSSGNIWPLSPATVAICLMRSPLIAVTSFQYYDAQGNQQTLTLNTDFVVDAVSEPPRLLPAPGGFWPTTQYRAPAVTITYTAGYATAAAVPGRMTLAMRMLLAHWWEHRESVSEMNLKEVPHAVDALLDSLRVPWEW
jgi:hypothetical protein